MSDKSFRYPLWVRGDLDGFFGLMVDNLVQVLLIISLCKFVAGLPDKLIFETVLPGSELEAVASGEQMGEILDHIAEEVQRHRTTLIFVNTRRMAERLAHQLGERLAPAVAEGEAGVLAPEIEAELWHYAALEELVPDRSLRLVELPDKKTPQNGRSHLPATELDGAV